MIIEPLPPDYRGTSPGVEIFVAGRSFQKPSKRRLSSRAWIPIGLYMGLIGAIYYATKTGQIDGMVGSMILIAMMFPLIMLSGGSSTGSKGGTMTGGARRGSYGGGLAGGFSLKPGMALGDIVERKHQRLIFGATCTREVYTDESAARFSTSFDCPKGGVSRHSRRRARRQERDVFFRVVVGLRRGRAAAHRTAPAWRAQRGLRGAISSA